MGEEIKSGKQKMSSQFYRLIQNASIFTLLGSAAVVVKQ